MESVKMCVLSNTWGLCFLCFSSTYTFSGREACSSFVLILADLHLSSPFIGYLSSFSLV